MKDYTARKVRIVLVDDHPFVRDGVAGLLSAQLEYEVVGEAGSLAEAVALCESARPSLVLVDLRLPDGDGSTLLAHLQRHHSQAFTVVLSAFRTEDDMIAAARYGARAYLMKTATGPELLATLRRVIAGEDVLGQKLNLRQRERLAQKDLTPMELSVLAAIGNGFSNQEVGAQFRIGANTVKTHLRNIFAKLGVKNRSQATAIAIRRGLVDR